MLLEKDITTIPNKVFESQAGIKNAHRIVLVRYEALLEFTLKSPVIHFPLIVKLYDRENVSVVMKQNMMYCKLGTSFLLNLELSVGLHEWYFQ